MTDVAPPGGEHKLGVEGTITGSEAVFHLTGELDLAGVARLERATAVAHDQGARTVVLDVPDSTSSTRPACTSSYGPFNASARWAAT